jgi:hypothetical protein
MPNGFFRSTKGEEMYAKIGRQYENTLKDDQYAAFLKKTANSPHSARNKKVVTAMIRERAEDGNEYLRYELSDTRYDAIGAEWTQYCPNQGVYPIPIAQPKIQFGENMSTQEVVTGDIIRYEMGYEFPFTKENVDSIHKLANDRSRNNRTEYIVSEYKGGRRFTILSYEDFRDKSFEELQTGKPPLIQQEVPKKK